VFPHDTISTAKHVIAKPVRARHRRWSLHIPSM